MTETLRFDRSHPGHYGASITLSPLVRRVVANNPGPFTFTGTVSHIVGRGQVAVIDPGPDDPDHIAALLAATAGETITHIVVTHTHRDHTDGVEALRAVTGATVVGCAQHQAARPLLPGEANALDASADRGYRPDRILGEGDVVSDPSWTLEAVPTPGHTANHLAFALREENALFPGDHVMAWSTTIVAPPDGSMADYKASLRRLIARSEDIYYPAHGPSLTNGRRHAEALLKHRELREDQILDALSAGPRTIPDLVASIYVALSPNMFGAAGLSVQAHLEELVGRGVVRMDAGPKVPVFSLA
ncbi:MBL fold metallo-hydrolase [Flaviflagellibacter deserti]|uniref:MBL fold metallo-hydrolase n=1 Tax=Flaviflagellibacter deserti TaxID=2267266 RepID=A0ABV9YX16_9HYPH